MADTARDRRTRIGRWLFVIALVGSALGLGALHTWILCAAAALVAASTCLLWFGADPLRARPVATILVWVGIGLTAFTLLQCVPFPMGVLSVASHKAADVWSRALTPLREPGPSWATLSIDPTATRIEVLRGVTYVLAFLTAWRLATQRRGTLFLQRAIVFASFALAVAAVFHPAIGAQKVFGVYQPRSPFPEVAPLLNANHLAAFINIGLTLGFASLFSQTPIAPRPVLGAVVALMSVTQIWIASRGGVGSMLLGFVLVLACTFLVRRGVRRGLVSLLLVGGVALAGAAMTLASVSESTYNGLTQTDFLKFDICWQALKGLVPAYPIFGTGRGAFESGFPEYRTSLGFILFTHPENVVVQWVTEWGVPVAVVAGALILYALRPRAVLVRSSLATGAWCAVVVGFINNLVDFSSELPAAMFAWCACAAIVVGGTRGQSSRSWLEKWSERPTLLAYSAPVLITMAVGFVAPGIGRELSEERLALYQRSTDRAVSDDSFRDQIRGALLRHPAEPYIAYSGAARAILSDKESIIPWVGHALERSPIYVPAHLMLARWLRPRSPSHARVEYRIALEQDPSLAATVASEGASLVSKLDDALELAPRTGELQVLEALVPHIRDRLPATRVQVDASILSHNPRAEGPILRAAQDSLADVQNEEAAPWCFSNRAACLKQAFLHVDALESSAPNTCLPSSLRAKLLMVSGDENGALQTMSAASDRVTDRSVCLRLFAELAQASKNDARKTEVIEKLGHAGCGTEAECVANLVAAAALEDARNNSAAALLLYKRAGERSHERDDLLALVANRAASAELHAVALDAYKKLLERHPDDAKYRSAISEQQRRIAQQLLEQSAHK